MEAIKTIKAGKKVLCYGKPGRRKERTASLPEQDLMQTRLHLNNESWLITLLAIKKGFITEIPEVKIILLW